MIKHLNTNEISNLKENLNELIKYRKLLYKKSKINEFYDEKLSLNEGIEIYRNIISSKYKINEYKDMDKNYTLLNYFIKNKVIDENDIDLIKDFFRNEEYNYHIYETLDKITMLIESISKNLSINLKYTNARDMIVEEVDKEFIDIKESLLETVKAYINNSDIEEEEEESDYEELLLESFDEIFEDDSRIFCFEGYKCDNEFINEINRAITIEYDGLKTAVLYDNNNLYLSISLYYLYLGFDIKFILLVIAFLILRKIH